MFREQSLKWRLTCPSSLWNSLFSKVFYLLFKRIICVLIMFNGSLTPSDYHSDVCGKKSVWTKNLAV